MYPRNQHSDYRIQVTHGVELSAWVILFMLLSTGRRDFIIRAALAHQSHQLAQRSLIKRGAA